MLQSVVTHSTATLLTVFISHVRPTMRRSIFKWYFSQFSPWTPYASSVFSAAPQLPVNVMQVASELHLGIQMQNMDRKLLDQRANVALFPVLSPCNLRAGFGPSAVRA